MKILDVCPDESSEEGDNFGCYNVKRKLVSGPRFNYVLNAMNTTLNHEISLTNFENH